MQRIPAFWFERVVLTEAEDLLKNRLGRRRFLQTLGASFTVMVGCTKPAPYAPHVFACDERRLADIATRSVGYQINTDRIERSSSGDQLRMIADYAPER